MIIVAKDMIVGRISTIAAKKALLGETIDIVNCESALITGRKKEVIEKYIRKKNLGTFKGPFLHRAPEKIVRRIVRGMLPFKKSRGREAYKRVMCYIGMPKEFEGKEKLIIEGAHISRVKTNYVRIKDISIGLGMQK